MVKDDLNGYLEFKSFLQDFAIDARPKDLLNAVEVSQIRTFGWAIAPVIHAKDFAPIPFNNGIKCTIKTDGQFDYWTLSNTGQFYILKTLFEDRRAEKKLFFDTRVIRTTEVFLRTARLYKQLNVPEESIMVCELEYGGLEGRSLTVANPNRMMPFERVCHSQNYRKAYAHRLSHFLNPETLTEVVFDYMSGLCQLFDFFEAPREVVIQIADSYIKGKVT